MGGQDQPAGLLVQAYGYQPYQRRPIQAQRPGTAGCSARCSISSVPGSGLVPPVVQLERRRNMVMHYLLRMLQIIPVETGPKQRMTVHHMLPCRFKSANVERASQDMNPVTEVHDRRLQAQAVKCLLVRPQRPEEQDELHRGDLEAASR